MTVLYEEYLRTKDMHPVPAWVKVEHYENTDTLHRIVNFFKNK